MGGLFKVFSLSTRAAFSAPSKVNPARRVSADDLLIRPTEPIGRRGDAAPTPNLLKSNLLIALSLVGGSFSSSSGVTALLFTAGRADPMSGSLLNRMWSRGGVGGRKMVCSEIELPRLVSSSSFSSKMRRRSSRAGVGLGSCRGERLLLPIDSAVSRVVVGVEIRCICPVITDSSRDTLLGRAARSCAFRFPPSIVRATFTFASVRGGLVAVLIALVISFLSFCESA